MSGIDDSLIAAILYTAARKIGAKFNDPCANAIDDTIKYFEEKKRIVIIREHLAELLEKGFGKAEIDGFKEGEKFIDIEKLAKKFAIFSDLYLEDESKVLDVCGELFSYFSNSLTKELIKDPETWKQTLVNMQNIHHKLSQEEHQKILEEIEKLSSQKKSPLEFPFEPRLYNQTPPEENFVGRKEELDTITDWYKSEKVRIGALIGWGGVGKSALVRKWYDSLEDNEIRPDGIFWWGFYRNAYLEQFLNALLRYISGGQIEPETIKGTWAKVDRIKEYIGKGTYLIILDGLEEMQKGKETGEEFGKMVHRECAEMLRFLADTKGNGLCLITTRYLLKDIKNYEGTVYQKEDIERLSIEDGRRLFEKVGIKGEQDKIDSVIEEYGGHALSLTLLARYLVEDFGGNITKAKEIPSFYSDKKAGGKAHRILLWYAKQLNEEQRAFMKIFSLFRRAVREGDFEGVFRAEMETEMNQVLIKMAEFSFKRMVDNLVDRRLISKDKDNTYATHPLIKNYFESIFEEEEKRLCHKRIYEYIGGYAPDRAETLEEMQPLFEQVEHGCAAGLYDEVFDDVYMGRIHRGRTAFLIHQLGAWETDFTLIKTFFPEGDLSKMPLVSIISDQSWLLNEAGLALHATGRPKEAEGPFMTGVKMDIKAKDWKNASLGYQNLAELRFRMGELEAGLGSAEKALEMAEKAESDENISVSKAYLGWIFYLLGKTEEAEKRFIEAGEIISGHRLYSYWGVLYADFFLSMNRIDEASELTRQNLEICQRNNWVEIISECHRNLGAIERIKGNSEQAEHHLQKALEIARKASLTWVEIEILIERGRLRLYLKEYEKAIDDAEQALKICERTGFRLHEPEAKIVLARAYLRSPTKTPAYDLQGQAFGDREKVPTKDPCQMREGAGIWGQAETYARTAYEKAAGMKYRWAEGDAAHLLGEIALAKRGKKEAQKWLNKAIKCRSEIKDPKVKESGRILDA